MSLTKTAKDGTITGLASPSTGGERIQMGFDPEHQAVIVELLTDAYASPIEATVRETISNAIDASVASGSTRPIKIVRPTAEQSVFVVRDYGPGMTKDIIQNAYTAYATSTKRTDFTQIGAKGLGAKAPLSYCNSFEVTTIQNGNLVRFVLERTDAGNFFEFLEEEEGVDIPDGTTVMVPVKPADHGEFNRLIERYQEHSLDIPLEVEGLDAPKSDLIEVHTLVLDPQTDTRGRVWLRKSALPEITKKIHDSGTALAYDFLLSGWVYQSHEPYRYNAIRDTAYVELRPGVVDFSNSRDEITQNDRLTELNSQVKTVMTGDGLRELLVRAFSQLTNMEAIEIMGRGVSGLFDDKKNYSNTGVRRTAFEKMSLKLITKEGISVNDLLMEQLTDPRVYSAFTLVGPHNRGSLVAALPPSAPGMLLRRSTTRPGMRLVKEVASSSPRLSLTSMIYNGEFDKAHVENTTVFNRYVLIKNATAEKTIKLVTGRHLIPASITQNALLVLVNDDPGVDQEAEDLMDEFDVTIETADIDDLLEQIKSRRAYLRLLRGDAPPAPSELTGRFNIPSDNPASSEAEFLDELLWTSNVQLDLQQLEAEDAIILIDAGFHDSTIRALTGAINAGVDVVNRRIFALDAKDLRLDHYKLIKDYPNLIFSRNVDTRSQLATNLKKDRAYSDLYLESSLDDFTRDEIAGLVLVNLSPAPSIFAHTSSAFLMSFGGWLMESRRDELTAAQKELFGGLSRVNPSSFTADDRGRAQTPRFADIAGEELPKAAQHFTDAVRQFKDYAWSSTLDGKLLHDTLNYSGEFPATAIRDLIFENVWVAVKSYSPTED